MAQAFKDAEQALQNSELLNKFKDELAVNKLEQNLFQKSILKEHKKGKTSYGNS